MKNLHNCPAGQLDELFAFLVDASRRVLENQTTMAPFGAKRSSEGTMAIIAIEPTGDLRADTRLLRRILRAEKLAQSLVVSGVAYLWKYYDENDTLKPAVFFEIESAQECAWALKPLERRQGAGWTLGPSTRLDERPDMEDRVFPRV